MNKIKPASDKTYAEALAVLAAATNAAYHEHQKWRNFDGWAYNLGTVFVILLTTAVAVMPEGEGVPSWVPKILAGGATAWVAIDRALAFGMRWRFHTELSGGYQMLINRIAVFGALPQENQKEAFEKIVTSFATLQAREASVPGSGASVQDSAKV